jgi:hypothetical protein
MIGRCFCGEVGFEFNGPMTDIELCHCSRCQRSSGSPFAAEFRVRAERFRWLRGEDRIACFDAPILREPPAYRHSFCRTCGSPLPSVFADNPVVAIPAGLVEGELPVRAMEHIWVSKRAHWLDFRALAELPQHREDPSEESNERLMRPLELGD